MSQHKTSCRQAKNYSKAITSRIIATVVLSFVFIVAADAAAPVPFVDGITIVTVALLLLRDPSMLLSLLQYLSLLLKCM